MKYGYRSAVLVLSGVVLAGQAAAMEVDDATVIAPHSCQVEGTLYFHRHGTNKVLSPACNVGENLELQASGAWNRDGGQFSRDWQLQGKTVLRPLETNGYGVALMASANRHAEAGERDMSYLVKVPLTFSLADDAVLLHLNAGVMHDKGEQGTRMVWGVGNEIALNDRFSLIGEVFGQNKGKSGFQAGVRTRLMPEKLEMDVTYGNKLEWEKQHDGVMLQMRWMMP